MIFAWFPLLWRSRRSKWFAAACQPPKVLAACRFGCRAVCGDDTRHYFFCPVVAGVFARRAAWRPPRQWATCARFCIASRWNGGCHLNSRGMAQCDLPRRCQHLRPVEPCGTGCGTHCACQRVSQPADASPAHSVVEGAFLVQDVASCSSSAPRLQCRAGRASTLGECRSEMQAMWTRAKDLIVRARFTMAERDPTKCLIWQAA